MKKVILTLIVIVILIVVLFVLKSQTSNAPQQTSFTPTATLLPSSSLKAESVSPQAYSIKITRQGVSPQNLNIKVGDTVTFTNLDSVPHWPASGVHPTHQICPGFDSLRGLAQNESYSHTFTEAKVCPFHDHVNASDSGYRGSITVSD